MIRSIHFCICQWPRFTKASFIFLRVSTIQYFWTSLLNENDVQIFLDLYGLSFHEQSPYYKGLVRSFQNFLYFFNKGVSENAEYQSRITQITVSKKIILSELKTPI